MIASKPALQGESLPLHVFLSVCSRNAPLLFPFNLFEEQEIVIGYLWLMSHRHLLQAKERDVFDGLSPPSFRAPTASQAALLLMGQGPPQPSTGQEMSWGPVFLHNPL